MSKKEYVMVLIAGVASLSGCAVTSDTTSVKSQVDPLQALVYDCTLDDTIFEGQGTAVQSQCVLGTASKHSAAATALPTGGYLEKCLTVKNTHDTLTQAHSLGQVIPKEFQLVRPPFYGGKMFKLVTNGQTVFLNSGENGLLPFGDEGEYRLNLGSLNVGEQVSWCYIATAKP